MRKRRAKLRVKLERVPLHECRTAHEGGSMDFVSTSLASGRRISCLTITDDFSHECVEIAPSGRASALRTSSFSQVLVG